MGILQEHSSLASNHGEASGKSNKWDIIVVGSGLAGLSAACRGAEAGARVLVLEKYETLYRLTHITPPLARNAPWDPRPSGCDTERSQKGISTLQILGGQYNDQLTTDEVVKRIVASGCGVLSECVVRAWAERLNHDIKWLMESVGLRYTAYKHPEVPDYRFGAIVGPMTEYLVKRGGSVLYGHTVDKLVVDERRKVTGVRAFTDDGFKTYYGETIVLAPGSFAGSAELCARYINAFVANEMLITGSPYNTGEWVKMGEEIGAKLINMDQMHIRTPDRKGGLGLKRLYNLSKHGILVDQNGQRLFDEARLPEQTDLLAQEMVRRASNAFLIFDQTSRIEFAKEYEFYRHPAEEFFVCAPTLAQLAEIEGISAAGLESTVAAFNMAVRPDGSAPLACPPKATNPDFARSAVRIETPPFYSFKVQVGLNHTLGGFKVNAGMQVLDLLERPIDGLYTAGEPMMSNIIYKNYKVASDAATGLEIALTTGCIAGEAAAAQALAANGNNAAWTAPASDVVTSAHAEGEK